LSREVPQQQQGNVAPMSPSATTRLASMPPVSAPPLYPIEMAMDMYRAKWFSAKEVGDYVEQRLEREGEEVLHRLISKPR
jgi:hypothetical protein